MYYVEARISLLSITLTCPTKVWYDNKVDTRRAIQRANGTCMYKSSFLLVSASPLIYNNKDDLPAFKLDAKCGIVVLYEFTNSLLARRRVVQLYLSVQESRLNIITFLVPPFYSNCPTSIPPLKLWIYLPNRLKSRFRSQFPFSAIRVRQQGAQLFATWRPVSMRGLCL